MPDNESVSTGDLATKQRELEDLRLRVSALEGEIARQRTHEQFQPQGYYTAYFATTGFMLGIFGAMASLLFNVVGSLLVQQHPLQLIRVYLTFPLGDRALEIDNGLALAIGCCLYLATGMLLGILFQLVISRFVPQGGLGTRLLVASIFAIVLWLVNFYVILSWLQPAVIPDMSPENLIVNAIPPWVAALTHLVFGWTMALVYPWGQFTPYRRMTERA